MRVTAKYGAHTRENSSTKKVKNKMKLQKRESR